MMNTITDYQIDRFYGEYERPSSTKRKSEKTDIRRMKLMVKKDCFAYRRARCNVLTEMVCRYGECSFYKTLSQDRADRKKYRLDTTYQPKEDKN